MEDKIFQERVVKILNTLEVRQDVQRKFLNNLIGLNEEQKIKIVEILVTELEKMLEHKKGVLKKVKEKVRAKDASDTEAVLQDLEKKIDTL